MTPQQIQKIKQRIHLAKNPGALAMSQLTETLKQIETTKGQKGDKGDMGPKGNPGESIIGPIGPQGPQGPEGKSITGPLGPRGLQGESITGPMGPQGQDGKTPIRGIDYYTPQDVEYIISEILKKVPKVVEKRMMPSISLIGRNTGGGGGQVKEIVAGTNVTIQKTDSGKYIISSSGSGGGITGTPSFNETPSGSIDDSNNIFTLAHTPDQTSIPFSLFLNGICQRAGGVDFTLSGGTITYVTPPASGSTMWANYYY